MAGFDRYLLLKGPFIDYNILELAIGMWASDF